MLQPQKRVIGPTIPRPVPLNSRHGAVLTQFPPHRWSARFLCAENPQWAVHECFRRHGIVVNGCADICMATIKIVSFRGIGSACAYCIKLESSATSRWESERHVPYVPTQFAPRSLSSSQKPSNRPFLTSHEPQNELILSELGWNVRYSVIPWRSVRVSCMAPCAS